MQHPFVPASFQPMPRRAPRQYQRRRLTWTASFQPMPRGAPRQYQRGRLAWTARSIRACNVPMSMSCSVGSSERTSYLVRALSLTAKTGRERKHAGLLISSTIVDRPRLVSWGVLPRAGCRFCIEVRMVFDCLSHEVEAGEGTRVCIQPTRMAGDGRNYRH